MTGSGDGGARTLVIRARREPISGGEWEWRGEVRDAVTAEGRYFRQLEGLLEALVEMLESGGARPDR